MNGAPPQWVALDRAELELCSAFNVTLGSYGAVPLGGRPAIEAGLTSGLVRLRGVREGQRAAEPISLGPKSTIQAEFKPLSRLTLKQARPPVMGLDRTPEVTEYHSVEVDIVDLKTYARDYILPGTSLLATEGAAPRVEKRSRRSVPRDRVRAAIERLYTDGIPDNAPQKQVISNVEIALEQEKREDKNLTRISRDTIRRYLGYRT